MIIQTALKRTRGLSGHAKAKEILRKKGRDIVSCHKFVCCNKEIRNSDLWILEDFKGYTKRKLFVSKCSVCGDDVCFQVMTSTKDNRRYENLYTGIEAVKTIYREKKRRVFLLPDVSSDKLYGWIYGVNAEIKNKKKEITQIRQYLSDFSGNKNLIKKMFLN